VDRRWKNPRSWTDFRVKMVVFPALARCPGAATEKLCRNYLALSDQEAGKLGPPLFEEVARALLAVSPRTETALELMKHRLQAVCGRAVLDCLAHAGQSSARMALEKGAPSCLALPADDGRLREGCRSMRIPFPHGWNSVVAWTSRRASRAFSPGLSRPSPSQNVRSSLPRELIATARSGG
jgi:hypothetical protein